MYTNDLDMCITSAQLVLSSRFCSLVGKNSQLFNFIQEIYDGLFDFS